MFKNLFFTVCFAAGVASATDLTTHYLTLDTDRQTRPFEMTITRGSTPLLRATILNKNVAVTNLGSFGAYLFYATNATASSGVSITATNVSNGTNGYLYFQFTSNQALGISSNASDYPATYWAQLVITNSTSKVYDWSQGKLRVRPGGAIEGAATVALLGSETDPIYSAWLSDPYLSTLKLGGTTNILTDNGTNLLRNGVLIAGSGIGSGFPLSSNVSAGWYGVSNLLFLRGGAATFSNITASGDITAGDDLTASDDLVVGDDGSFGGDVTISGDLTVTSNTIYNNVTTYNWSTNITLGGTTTIVSGVIYQTNYTTNVVYYTVVTGSTTYVTNYITNTVTYETYVNAGGHFDASNAAWVALPTLYSSSSNTHASGTWNMTGAHVRVASPTVGSDAANADWVRGLFAGGGIWYGSQTSAVSTVGFATNRLAYLQQGIVCHPATNVVTAPTNGEWVAGGITTSKFTSVMSPINFEYYFAKGGLPSSALSVAPYVYYTYDRTNLLGGYTVTAQQIDGDTFERTPYVVAFTEPVITGEVWIVGRLRASGVVGSPTLSIGLGTNHASNLAIKTPSDSGTGSGFPLESDGDLAGYSLTNGFFVGDGSGLTNLTTAGVDTNASYTFATNTTQTIANLTVSGQGIAINRAGGTPVNLGGANTIGIGSGANASTTDGIAIGDSATSYQGSLAVGKNAFAGQGDVAIGYGANVAKTGNDRGVAVGYNAIVYSTWGNGTAIGGESFVRGNDSVAVGYYAGKSSWAEYAGDYYIALGGYSMGRDAIGDKMVAHQGVGIGYYSAWESVTTNGIFVGYSSGFHAKGHSLLGIGFRAAQNVTGSYVSVIGDCEQYRYVDDYLMTSSTTVRVHENETTAIAGNLILYDPYVDQFGSGYTNTHESGKSLTFKSGTNTASIAVDFANQFFVFAVNGTIWTNSP